MENMRLCKRVGEYASVKFNEHKSVDQCLYLLGANDNSVVAGERAFFMRKAKLPSFNLFPTTISRI